MVDFFYIFLCMVNIPLVPWDDMGHDSFHVFFCLEGVHSGNLMDPLKMWGTFR